jgi:hypothetical protein
MTCCRPAHSAVSRNISRPAPSNTATGTGNSLKIATSPPLVRRSNQSLKWIIKGADFTKLDADAHVGRRAIALFWTLNPDYFEGVSLTALAKPTRLAQGHPQRPSRRGPQEIRDQEPRAGPRLELWQVRTETDAQGWSIGRGSNVTAEGAAFPVQQHKECQPRITALAGLSWLKSSRQGQLTSYRWSDFNLKLT